LFVKSVVTENRLWGSARCARKQVGSHRKLQKPGWRDFTFCFHDNEEVGSAALAKIAKDTGLRPEDL
jgi:predicted RNA binding protein YcfA (HicA-like mRNA interferase family)